MAMATALRTNVCVGKRGFEWVKWVTSIEVNESPNWLQPPLPLQ